MNYKVIIGLFIAVIALSACKDDCVTCKGATADQKVCPDDYNEKSDFQNYVSEYEQLENGICE